MKRQRGQGLVEFALILPVLLLIILGIVEAALLIQGYLTVQHAAREAARFAVTYQPIQGQCLNGDPAPYPFCPRDEPELKEDYHARRVELIKWRARQAATGLRINDDYLGTTRDGFDTNSDKAGFFGVAVWGYPSFQTECNAYAAWDEDNPCFDHPGLEGLPVQVLVVHNVEIIDPLYSTVVEHVPVRADTEMINEGIQVGKGDQVPPDFSENPNYGETPLPTPTTDLTSTPTHTPTPTETLTPTPSPTPFVYFIQLSEDATNALPDDRDHEFVATVTDGLGMPVEGQPVSFSTDEGGFSYSGADPKYTERTTNDLGQASAALFGNRPGTATVRAWLDYDGDDKRDDGEPSDSATKTWNAVGPYVTVSDHTVIPQQSIKADVMDHPPAGNPYRLLWCVVSGTDITRTVVSDLYVDDDGWDATNLDVHAPEGSEGLYRLETHSGSGDCGSTDLVAHSANILVSVLDPDLSVSLSGDVWVLVGGVPWTLRGVDVWAYGGGEVYHTSTDLDGTYTFSSIPPGIYTIYAEAWIGAWLRSATATEVVYDDLGGVDLFLL